jgi:hypothetical protein
MGEPKIVTADELRRELRRVLSRSETERIVARLYSDTDRLSVDERARRAAEGIDVDELGGGAESVDDESEVG